MKWKLLVIFLFLALAEGQQPPRMDCHPSMENGEYTANIFLYNMQGPFVDTFENCNMTHLAGKSDDDVRRIILSGDSLNIPSAVCRTFPAVRHLQARHLQLSVIYFLFNCGNLLHLDLSQNNIDEIAPNTFANTPNLISLNLAENNIAYTSPNSFINLFNLEVLDLSSNQDIPLVPLVFQHLNNLKRLDLSHSTITSLNTAWFNNLRDLVELDISNNPLSDIPSTAFSSLINLQKLDMSSCSIKGLNPQTFNRNPKLNDLDMSFNDMTSLQSALLRNQTSLVTLNLSNNGFEPFPDDIFLSLVNLRKLMMNNCQLANLRESWFATTSELRVLGLAGNLIKEIPYKTFGAENYLEELYLQNNELEVLDATSFGLLRNLKELRVQNNRINAVDFHFIRQPASLNTAHFSDNVCMNENFYNFNNNRTDNLRRFDGCFRNFDQIPIIIETSPDEVYHWFSMRWQKFIFHVKARENVTIFLSEFASIDTNSSLEIQIGMGRNHFVWIFENGQKIWEDEIDTIISENEYKSFVLSWASNVLQFYEKSWQLAAAVHTISNPFNIEFFGIRADTPASFHILRMEHNFKHDDFPETPSPPTTIASTLPTTIASTTI